MKNTVITLILASFILMSSAVVNSVTYKPQLPLMTIVPLEVQVTQIEFQEVLVVMEKFN